MGVKEFEERERERRETEKKEKAVNSHDRPDVPPDKTPDLKPQDEVARRDPESKKVRDEQLARADGPQEKAEKTMDGVEKKLDNMERKQDSHEKAREQDRQRDERTRERER